MNAPTTELLTWHLCADTLPDADITVLMWLIDPDDSADNWFSGWWDGATWHDASHGGEVYGTVTHWAEPSGPNVETKAQTRQRWDSLVSELRHIAVRCEFPDGDYVPVSLQTWAEDWIRRLEAPNFAMSGSTP